ncbi:hypothetical protein [Bradyrhizobium sp. 2TAF24]|uniref:hypothetical protein n=1 Tax=Bradyrhizobium sp. 2TAF24 TaxID=3233011 RepID=UPI003F9376E1
MSEAIPFPTSRTAGNAAGTVDEALWPLRDVGWLLYAIIEIEIAQATLAAAIAHLPSTAARDRLQADHADLKRQMKMVRAALEQLMQASETERAASLRP